jgi:protein phosphatase PTC7
MTTLLPHDFTSIKKNETTYETNTEPLQITCAAAYRPKAANPNREGLIDCGEDAFFCIQHRNMSDDDTRAMSLGVADGVGGYSEWGIDSSHMAWALMSGCAYYLEQEPSLSCKEALCKTYQHIVDEHLVLAGAATACVLQLNHGRNEQGEHVMNLTSANIGDSGFMILRDGNVIYRTSDQTHFFNCPKQLSVPLDPTVSYDSPQEADEILTNPLELKRGDLLVCFTDGLSDNLFDSDVSDLVALRQLSQSYDPDMAQSIANDILRNAIIRAHSQTLNTPFAEYSQLHGYTHSGGKIDDITVLVCLIH